MTPTKSLIEQLRAIVTDIREHTLYDYIGAKASTTFPEIDAACAQAADRLETLTAPVEMETTEEERARFAAVAGPAAAAWADKSLPTLDRMTRSIVSVDGDALHRLLRDADKAVRLAAQLAAEKADAADAWAHAEAVLEREQGWKARADKTEAALKERDDQWQAEVGKLCVDVRVDDMPLTEITRRILAIRAVLGEKKP